MPSMQDLKETPRRELDVFYVLDASRSMSGVPIATLNRAMAETAAELKEQAKHNADALIKIAVLEYNSGCRWLTGDKAPEEVENFTWRKLTAGGRSDMGAVLKELNSKLSTRSFLSSMYMTGAYYPVIIFGVGSSATDSYKDALEQIRQNRWFRNATKIGFAIGVDSDKAMLAEIVGSSEAVITGDNLESFVKMLKFVSVTSPGYALSMEERSSIDIVSMAKGEKRCMGKFYAFHKSVRGHLHIMKDIPCEDWSESYADEGGQFYIAVVADGHGDTACMRSATGARKAAQIAKECLVQFAKAALSEQDNVGERLKRGRYMDVLRPLTETIVSRWSYGVMEELSSGKNPLTEEELNQAGSYADAYRNGEKLLHVYGTTLLAALMLPDYLILLQQGDGRYVVFYEDGTVEEPIMLDERCHENVTTSMCDVDAPLSLLKHSVVIPLRDKKVMACWLGCDGVEDSCRDIRGTYTFYRKLMCELNARKGDGFEVCLTEHLLQLSKMGSGDDVSVSGIVDMDCIEAVAPSFSLQLEEYRPTETMDDSFNNAMRNVIGMAGKEILKDKSRMNAYLSDMGSKYKKEIHIFVKSCDSSLLDMFYESDKAGDAQRSQAIRRARQILIQKEGLDGAWADTLIDALTYALNWK